ncbi:NRDE family protein [Shewanella intestini]|uniref:NRDE family protein n=1 Tax=Shewanella intestini TaxID=2017544 RepID=A0ABS5I5K0_9GAMM|nr:MULTISPECIES: NRDE family protein [Shewanella]MBR9729297.1 NRDE family protein [Shewanella intestini]MRG37376.1 hypothetical protein [Shewanella sp. XMDDZSB0408]
MCILFIAVNVHPQYPLVVCANRDEFHHRPTQPAQYWLPNNANDQILAGRDLQAGGTWLGVSLSLQFAALTNLRQPSIPTKARSRGELVIMALQGKITQAWLMQHASNYAPFNLIFQTGTKLFCFNSLTMATTSLTTGFHTISNGDLQDKWPKMTKGEQALESLINQHETLDKEQLINLMLDQSTPDDKQLPSTGIAIEWERLLSPIFIQHPEYGTRSTTIILQNQQSDIEFTERRYDGKARNLGQQTFWLSPQ